MNYDRYYTYDMVNGPGLRVTLFVTGCAHACPGCHNESLWDRKAGKPFTPEVQEELLQACADHDGLSLSGGDPLHPANRDAILALCQAFKARYPEKNIWLWTGYTLTEVMNHIYLQDIDVLIDGKYNPDLKTSNAWLGSSNQKIIFLNQALRTTS